MFSHVYLRLTATIIIIIITQESKKLLYGAQTGRAKIHTVVFVDENVMLLWTNSNI
jgi:hypothetical protein